MTVNDEEFERYVDDYIVEVTELIKNHLGKWLEQFPITEQVEDNPYYGHEIDDMKYDFCQTIDLSIYDPLIEANVYDMILTIEDSMFSAIKSLPSDVNVHTFLRRYIDNYFRDYSRLSHILYENLMQKIKAVLIIQRKWRESISNPMYRLCRKRLEGEFSNLTSA